MTMKHLLDSDILIRAKNDHYAMDFCPAFWDWLIVGRKNGQVFSIRAVYDELAQAPEEDDEEEEDDLSKWVKSDGNCLFLPHDQPMADKMAVVALWANSQQYNPGAIATFLACADYRLVCYALAHGCTVVTHERSAPDSKHKIKLPDACAGVGVRCIKPFDMLRALGAKFVLK
jgi:Domain of unknown function (DUF4411)